MKKKKILMAAAAVILALALVGCHVSASTTTTTTESHTDANGTTTTTTTTTTFENGKANENTTTVVEEAETEDEAEDEIVHTVATIAFRNDSGMDIYALYFAAASAEDWGGNAVKEGEPLQDGYTTTFEDALTYSEENLLWDMLIEDADGNEYRFNGLDVSEAADPEFITVVITCAPEKDSYTAYIE